LQELSGLHGERLRVYPKDEGLRNDFPALLASPAADTQIYACGPARMLEALESCCAAWPEDALRIEHFHSTGSTLDPAKEHGFQVEYKDPGVVRPGPADQAVLDTLRADNIDVQCDCGEGLCGSCEAPVVQGEIDHRDVVLTRAERDQNNKMM